MIGKIILTIWALSALAVIVLVFIDLAFTPEVMFPKIVMYPLFAICLFVPVVRMLEAIIELWKS